MMCVFHTSSAKKWHIMLTLRKLFLNNYTDVQYTKWDSRLPLKRFPWPSHLNIPNPVCSHIHVTLLKYTVRFLMELVFHATKRALRSCPPSKYCHYRSFPNHARKSLLDLAFLQMQSRQIRREPLDQLVLSHGLEAGNSKLLDAPGTVAPC